VFIPILLLVLAQFSLFSPPPTLTGIASQYDPGVMSHAISYRQRHHQIPHDLSSYSGFMAVLESDNIGREYWVRPINSSTWEKFLAVDCAGIADGGYSWMVNSGIIAEIDYDSAVRWGVVGIGVEIEMIPLTQ